MPDKKILLFKSGNNIFAIDVNNVIEIISEYKLYKLPLIEKPFTGICVIRKEPIPAIDFKEELYGSSTDKGKIIVIEINKNKAGLLVEEVVDIYEYKEEDLKIPSEFLKGKLINIIKGFIIDKGEIYILILPEKIVTAKGIEEVKKLIKQKFKQKILF